MAVVMTMMALTKRANPNSGCQERWRWKCTSRFASPKGQQVSGDSEDMSGAAPGYTKKKANAAYREATLALFMEV